MTLEKLNQYLETKRELEKIGRLRESLRAAAEPGAQVITGMPRASGYKNKLGNLAAEIADLSREIESLRTKLNRQKPEIIKFVASISDGHTRTIFRLRFLRGLGWGEIAKTIDGGNTASSVRMICLRYIKKRRL